MRIKFYRSRRLRTGRREWRWTLYSVNNRKLGASSEGFANFADCDGNLAVVTGFRSNGNHLGYYLRPEGDGFFTEATVTGRPSDPID